MDELSLLHPSGVDPEYKRLPDATLHDLSVDTICEALSQMEPERNLIRRTLSLVSGKPEVIRYRCDVFEDILNFPDLREELHKLLDRVDFLRTYGSFAKETDAAGIWELAHRLGEMDEYIDCVSAIYKCLNERKIQSEGLLALKAYVKELYEDSGFEALQKDIKKLKIDASEICSVTLGVNLNDRFEPVAIGIVSINDKYFTKSGLLANFCDFLVRGDEIHRGTEWKQKYGFRTAGGEFMETMEGTAMTMTRMRMGIPGLVTPNQDMRADDVIHSLNRAATAMLSGTVRKLKTMLSRHVNVSTQVIAGMIPELLYYIRWAEYVEKLQAQGFTLCKPEPLGDAEAAAGGSAEFWNTGENGNLNSGAEKMNGEAEAAGVGSAEFRNTGENGNRNSGAKKMNGKADAAETAAGLADRKSGGAAASGTAKAAGSASAPEPERAMYAEGLYNIKLVKETPSDVVPNDIVFDRAHRLYILTGANRGGKTTITQAIGIAFLLAQGGIYVPANRFVFSPADCIFTHFPADENQTMDLGRLGEESKRFREIFLGGTKDSLYLLNESFSTTSFEEGYYIAYDAVRALRDLGARTIYNTHMHKLARALDELNSEGSGDSLVASLVAEAEDGKRSYRVRVAQPQGLSYAHDIAEKYGVTYEQLMQGKPRAGSAGSVSF